MAENPTTWTVAERIVNRVLQEQQDTIGLSLPRQIVDALKSYGLLTTPDVRRDEKIKMMAEAFADFLARKRQHDPRMDGSHNPTAGEIALGYQLAIEAIFCIESWAESARTSIPT